MAWPCYLVEFHPQLLTHWREVKSDNKPWDDVHGAEFDALLQWKDLRPGAMWWDGDELSVKLPSGSEWNIDQGRRYNVQPERAGKKPLPAWTRTGEPPRVTAYPSINHQGKYHGWLKDGVLTDDCEGRTFSR